MSCHKDDTTRELRETFEKIWQVKVVPNLPAMKTEEYHEWKGRCYDFFLYGAHEAARKLKKAGGTE